MKLDKYLVDIDKLKAYGFKKDGDHWSFEKKIDAFDITIILDNEFKNMDADVYDSQTKDKFFPFYVQSEKSTYTSNIAQDVDSLEKDILNKCFIANDIREELYNWCLKQWPDTEVLSWDKFPKYDALKDKKTGKWYALFMNVKLSSLDASTFPSNHQEVNVVNLKLDDEVESLIDHKNFFPAFHQSKQNWVSVMLDQNTNADSVKKLIQKSYNLATK